MATNSPNGKIVHLATHRAARAKRSRTQVHRCILIVGNRNAGKLISWILSWSRKAGRKYGLAGTWNANSRESIMAGCGLSEKQYRLAREHLTAIGAAEFAVHSFAGKRMAFTRPTEKFMCALADGVTLCTETPIRTKGHDEGHGKGTIGARSGHDEGHDLIPSVPSDLLTFGPDSDVTSESTSENQRIPESSRARTREAHPEFISDDWQPSPRRRQAAIDKGIDPDVLTRRFVQWHQAKRSRFADYDPVFQSWIDSEKLPEPVPVTAKAEMTNEQSYDLNGPNRTMLWEHLNSLIPYELAKLEARSSLCPGEIGDLDRIEKWLGMIAIYNPEVARSCQNNPSIPLCALSARAATIRFALNHPSTRPDTDVLP